MIAVDRYRKICVPLGKQMSLTVAKAIIVVVMGVSLLMSWPAPVLYGHATVQTRVQNISGVRCFTDDKFKDTKYQLQLISTPSSFSSYLVFFSYFLCFLGGKSGSTRHSNLTLNLILTAEVQMVLK